MKFVVAIAGFIAAVLVLVAFLGWRFELGTQERVATMADGQFVASDMVSFSELEGLPPPVQQYLRIVLREGVLIPRTARIAQAGELLVEPPAGWATFAAVEYFGANPPGFVWDARIDMPSGLKVKARDAFVDGIGEMRVSMFGAIPLVDLADTPDIAQGALIRYLAEGVWFPVALLPSRGVQWSARDERSATAALTVGNTTVAVDFFFDDDGLVERVYCATRMRDVNGRGVPTPWQGRMSQYSERGGMLVPGAAEVSWLLPEGEQVYWRGRVTDAQYK